MNNQDKSELIRQLLLVHIDYESGNPKWRFSLSYTNWNSNTDTLLIVIFMLML